jgi:hypothetical protein
MSKTASRLLLLAALLISTTALSIGALAQTSASACKAEGPDSETTRRYIVTSSDDTTAIEIDQSNGKLYFYQGDYFRYIIDYMSLDCNSTDLFTAKDGKLLARLQCKTGLKCIRWQEGNQATSQWYDTRMADGSTPTYTFYGVATKSGDSELTRNLANAMMHYIVLLQQDFRAKHTTNDPFARP